MEEKEAPLIEETRATSTPKGPGKFRPRGRYFIVVPFERGSYIRIETLKHRNLTATEIRDDLRTWANRIDEAIGNARREGVDL